MTQKKLKYYLSLFLQMGNNMTKRLIDADVLLEKIDKIRDEQIDMHCGDIGEMWAIKDVIDDIKNCLSDLAEHEPQESIFDADGWCKNIEAVNQIPPLEHKHWLLKDESGKFEQTICSKEYMEALCVKIGRRRRLVAFRELAPVPQKG